MISGAPDDAILAPWDANTVAVLEAFQASAAPDRHVCQGLHDAPPLLGAQAAGLVCPACQAVQFWCRPSDIQGGLAALGIFPPDDLPPEHEPDPIVTPYPLPPPMPPAGDAP